MKQEIKKTYTTIKAWEPNRTHLLNACCILALVVSAIFTFGFGNKVDEYPYLSAITSFAIMVGIGFGYFFREFFEKEEN